MTPKHESGNPTAFTNEVQAAAEHLLAVVDGKPKEVFGGTYSQIKEILGKIHESGYFDQAQVSFYFIIFALYRLFEFLLYKAHDLQWSCNNVIFIKCYHLNSRFLLLF